MLALDPVPDRRLSPPTASDAMAQAAGGRLTVVRSDGKVLVDSEADAAKMENHRTRPELIQAFRAGTARSTGTAPRSGFRSCTWRCRCRDGRHPHRGAALGDQPAGQAIRVKILAGTALAFLPAW